MRLDGTGIWSSELRYGDAGRARQDAAELESLGYRALWLPDVGGDLFGALANLLGATQHCVVATGILNVWLHEAAETAAAYAALNGEHGGRFLMGLGVSHQALIDIGDPGRYTKPLSVMGSYLDALDAASPPVPVDGRVLAALRPKMVAMARERAGGVHPYFVTPEHTHQVREAIGAEGLLAPEQAVVLETDPDRARGFARTYMATYLHLPNYTGNLEQFGFFPHDFADGGSDRLVDAIVAWGDDDAIAQRVQAHRDAGADHVCIQVIAADGAGVRDGWRQLAPALTSAPDS